MAWISAPARSSGVAIEELHTWRTAAYMVIYSLPMPLALAAVAAACVRVLRHGDETRLTRICAAVILLTGSISAFDHLSRIVTGHAVPGYADAFTTWRSESNDVLSFRCNGARHRGRDTDHRRGPRRGAQATPRLPQVITLAPMWKDLSTGSPDNLAAGKQLVVEQYRTREHR
ncbi:hypothetical protein GS489_33505 [Rhodococcus hoagii]|nr:hypothetical protein [Prescottella equi]